jgi:hypothetical protein
VPRGLRDEPNNSRAGHRADDDGGHAGSAEHVDGNQRSRPVEVDQVQGLRYW